MEDKVNDTDENGITIISLQKNRASQYNEIFTHKKNTSFRHKAFEQHTIFFFDSTSNDRTSAETWLTTPSHMVESWRDQSPLYTSLALVGVGAYEKWVLVTDTDSGIVRAIMQGDRPGANVRAGSVWWKWVDIW